MSAPISRWVITDLRCSNTYSIGSSSVRMWHARSRLIKSIMLARVVDFPAPVGPVTITRPLGEWSS